MAVTPRVAFYYDLEDDTPHQTKVRTRKYDGSNSKSEEKQPRTTTYTCMLSLKCNPSSIISRNSTYGTCAPDPKFMVSRAQQAILVRYQMQQKVALIVAVLSTKCNNFSGNKVVKMQHIQIHFSSPHHAPFDEQQNNANKTSKLMSC
jgi:hypothetical protein